MNNRWWLIDPEQWDDDDRREFYASELHENLELLQGGLDKIKKEMQKVDPEQADNFLRPFMHYMREVLHDINVYKEQRERDGGDILNLIDLKGRGDGNTDSNN
jgi:hypothetical protein